jgi:hypothetical protein
VKPSALAILGLCAFGVLAGCRTSIKPYVKPAPNLVYVGDKSCNVYDYQGATEVPDGAQNLGWVEVEMAATDDETFVLLRQKICELGGDALSQPAWVRSGSDESTQLKANAWVLP